MKFAGLKKERVIFYSAVAGAVGVGLFVLMHWVILPLFESRATLEVKLEEQRVKLKKARRELDYLPGLQRNYYDVVGQLAKIRSENILRPILGSYLVGVTEQVESVARTTGVKIEDVREVGVAEMPRKEKGAAPSSFKVFAVLVYGQGSYESISHFLVQMEAAHPFLCVSDIGIVGQPENPEMQRVTLRMEFPVEPATETAKEGGA